MKLGLAATTILLGVIPAKADSLIQFLARERTVPVETLTVPAGEFKSDGDPDTVELVVIVKPKDGASRFVEDGAVVFLRPDISEPAMNRLLQQAQEARIAAFEKRLKAVEGTPAQ